MRKHCRHADVLCVTTLTDDARVDIPAASAHEERAMRSRYVAYARDNIIEIIVIMRERRRERRFARASPARLLFPQKARALVRQSKIPGVA